MASIYILYRNIYENGTVTVTTENSSYPKERLYDRDIGKLYKGTSTAAHHLHVDQGATTQYDVDTCIIPAGHNLDTGGAADIYLRSSDNDADWTTEDSETNISDDSQIELEMSAAETHRYWKIQLGGLGAAPELAEIFMGEKVEFDNCVLYGGDEGKRGNIVRTESLSGIPHFLQQGIEREYRRYSFFLRTATQRTNMENFLSHSRGKAFWMKDLDGNWYFMSLIDPNAGPLTRPLINRYEIVLEFIEVPA